MTAFRRRAALAAASLLAVLTAVCSSPTARPAAGRAADVPPTRTASVRHVVLMSFDGLTGEAARQAFPPEMVAQAAYTWQARTTLPSSTLPAHTSMLTGVPTEIHGVRINPPLPVGHIRIPTVFSVVTASGGRAAAFVTKPKLLYLVPPGTVDRSEHLPYPHYDMMRVAREGARYLATMQPHLLFLHIADPDDIGHRYGWSSVPYAEAAARVPQSVRIILDVLTRMRRLDDSLVIVTSDHGGRGRRHGGSTPEELTIPWLAFGAVAPGPIAARVMIYDTAATAIAALGMPVPGIWRGTRVVQTVEKGR